MVIPGPDRVFQGHLFSPLIPTFFQSGRSTKEIISQRVFLPGQFLLPPPQVLPFLQSLPNTFPMSHYFIPYQCISLIRISEMPALPRAGPRSKSIIQTLCKYSHKEKKIALAPFLSYIPKMPPLKNLLLEIWESHIQQILTILPECSNHTQFNECLQNCKGSCLNWQPLIPSRNPKSSKSPNRAI